MGRTSRAAVASPFDMYSYWLMPHGLRGIMATVFWPLRRGPARRRSFMALAPGKLGRELGEHTFWRGSAWGRTVALQGDSSFTKFDLFELAPERLLYWGTFRGNGFYGSEESHSFASPYGWMDRWMCVGDFTRQRVTDSVMDPRLRRRVVSGELTLRVEVVEHYDAWRDPDSGIEYRDVLEVHYWGRYPEESSKEIYHLGRWLGTIRFETLNADEPSGVRYQYALSFERYTPPDQPALPWFDPFRSATHVPNGFCEEFLLPPSTGAAVATHLRGWAGTPDAVISDDAPDEGTGPWQIVLRGSTEGGDGDADFAAVSDWIPVTPGRRYRLSGSLWRVSEADNVYLDFDDGRGQGGNFEDAQAMASRTHVWERVAAEATVGPETVAIRVRCVRDGANEGNAYCDGVTLQRLD